MTYPGGIELLLEPLQLWPAVRSMMREGILSTCACGGEGGLSQWVRKWD